MMYKRYTTILFLLFSLSVFGQASVQFVPELYGRNVDGLLRCTILNTGQRQTVYLSVTVTERKAGTICLLRTTPFTIVTGNNQVPLAVASHVAVQFSSGTTGRLTSANRTFPEGDYEYCYTLNYTSSDLPPVERCYDYLLAPFAQLNLINPYNQDKICDQRPMLTWTPLLPGVPGAYYQLVLAEIKSGQNATEALNYNLPVINQSQLLSPVLPYPSIAPALEKGKTYAWQVTAYKNQTVLNRTDIWSFTVSCPDSVKKIADDGYRDIEDLLRGNFYVAVGAVKFALINPYHAQNLRYEISAVNQVGKKIKHLPKLELLNGENKIVIDLSENSAFKDNNYYLLKVWLPNGAAKTLRFLYTELK
jgi:hypothetical protein